jgi:hypothetical protein
LAKRREWTIGRHQAHLEEPDLLVVKLGGPTGIADARALTELYRELGSHQPIFAIINVTGSPADAEARSYYTREARPEWFRAIVYVGAGVVERAVGKAMAVAFSFAGRSKTEFLYASTQEEARGLIDQLRAKQATQAS